MPTKSSGSRVKYAAKTTKESRSRYRSAPKTSELANSIAELKASVLELIARVEAIDQKLSEFETRTVSLDRQAQHDDVTQRDRGLAEEDLSWLRLAESSFAFWDNEEDAIYDEL